MARLLFVTSRLPYPPREGHQLRSWHLLRAAAGAHRVDLLSLRRAQDPARPDPALEAVASSVHTVALAPLSDPGAALRFAARWAGGGQSLLGARYVDAALRARFRELVGGADLVHLDILAVADLQREVPASVPVVLNEHNVEHQLLRAQAGVEPRAWRRRLLGWRAAELEGFEADACARAACVLACSEIDAQRLRALAPQARVEVVPNGVDLDAHRPAAVDDRDEGGLVFVGQMGWFPNRDGIADFMAQALPLIRQRHAVLLQVIGERAGMAAPAGLEDAVEFTGFVDDLRSRVQAAAVYVVPLRVGGGTRLKILEAMAMGKAIVSTRIGAEGIGLVDGQDALLADAPADFAAAVCRLLDDPALRRRLGAAARRSAEARFGWEAIGARLLAVYAALLAPPAAD